MSSPAPLDRRASRKAEKRERIIAAARQVFRTRGFAAATTSEIAVRARIATGTLFLYAADKHELLLMIFNDELDRITEESIADSLKAGTLGDLLSAFFRRRFEFWAADPELGRLVTADVYASRLPAEVGTELARAQKRQKRMLSSLVDKIALHAVRENLELQAPADILARAAHYLYIGELRIWLASEKPNVRLGRENLRRLHDILINGAVK
jgi:AcrR family transcriptional regulator